MTVGRRGAVGRAGVLLIALTLTAACGSRLDPDARGQRSQETRSSPLPGPAPSDETAQSSCSPPYSSEALKQNQFAFDGTVNELGERLNPANPAQVIGTAVFSVAHWYKGGGATELTLQSSLRLRGDVLPIAGGPEVRVGDRLLVSGNGAFLGTCGFTRMWTEQDQSAWAEAFKR